MWIEISEEAYRSLRDSLGDDREIHSSCTDLDCEFHSEPTVVTEYCYKGRDVPMLRTEVKYKRGDDLDIHRVIYQLNIE